MCSPTRAALLCGRNHHRVASGQIAELANDWDGYAGIIPKSSATVAEVLKDYGYATSAFGKWHNTPAEQTTAAGPFDYWPDGLWLRVLLRLPRRRSVAVRAVPGAEHDLRRTPPHLGRARLLPPERRPRRRRDQLLAPAQGVRAGQAVLHVLGQRRCPRPAPRHEGMGRQVQGQVRRRLGQVPRARLQERQGQGLDSRQRGEHAAARRPGVLGQHSRRPRSPSSAASWRCTPGSPSTWTTRSAGSWTKSRTSATATTR